MIPQKITTNLLLALYVAGIVVLDRMTKSLAERIFLGDGTSFFGGLARFKYVQNDGIAFGIGITGPYLIALTLVVMAGVAWFGLFRDETRATFLSRIAYSSILAGALSNAYDRIGVGKVVDFIGVKYFAIFNVADIFIT